MTPTRTLLTDTVSSTRRAQRKLGVVLFTASATAGVVWGVFVVDVLALLG